ncbi:polysulfide reductase NrfD [Dissulfurirhabdus thermomarina]|uniref:Polysulfide reductase NrfD n=1 Tax=Dissulfurirhabdus thermomarina TaxID=1765737 RepID=A0A6N9TNT5_DISTH|nr:NrfD/PsrC family molybdoenzyme membrane anchor subunit [Dissulfurirhabdus thermomarina]NDY42951.1 polysulfide reductase NrfD [Dissulfurirhabdus thermomarina]NMX23792.1 polysulfide reductase NrfD [Dissulfurirhabdus thermomarina]
MKKRLNGLAWLLASVGFVIGLYGLYQRFTLGHRMADYGSYIPWGLWVAAYIYFIGLSAGSFLLSTLVYVARIERLEKIGKLSLFTAFACLVGALISIWLDLGHEFRVYRVVLHPNFRSMMSWMGILYSSYFLIILVELWFAMRVDLIAAGRGQGASAALARVVALGSTDTSDSAVERDRRILKVLGSIGVPLAIAFHGGVGALFGVVGARTYWHSGLTPIAFLVGALASGGALLAAIVYVWGPDRDGPAFEDMMRFLGKVVLAIVLLDLLLEVSEFFVGLYSEIPDEAIPIRAVLFGSRWYVFWVVHIFFGVLVPVWLLFRNAVLRRTGEGGRAAGAVALAGFLVAVTFMAVRLNIVIPAQINPEIAGLEYAFTGPGLKYTYLPTLGEWLVTVWVSSFSVLLFLVGYKLLPIVGRDDREVA